MCINDENSIYWAVHILNVHIVGVESWNLVALYYRLET